MSKRVGKEVFGIADIERVAQQLLEASSGQRVWLWEGEMGSGKTTLIKAVCHLLGVTGTMTSPTFSIVNQYSSPTKGVLYHFDFYRLKNVREALDIGVEEYLDSGYYCFLEWPELVIPLIETSYFSIQVSHLEGTNRVIEYYVHDGKEENRI